MNHRWVLCANHMEPVKGFLGRYLRRKLLEHELRECAGTRNAEMAAVVEWLPRVWQYLNKFLETHSSSDVTIGNNGKYSRYIFTRENIIQVYTFHLYDNTQKEN